MSDRTAIEWTDATVNAINGCSVLSPGCAHCYAMRLAGTRMKGHPTRSGLTLDTKTGPVWTGEVRLNEQAMMQPLRWKKARRIFWNAHGDIFHPAVPDEWIDRCFAVMAMTPQHIHQVLTKRADRMRQYLSDPSWAERISSIVNGWPADAIGSGNEFTADFNLCFGDFLPNVWLGVSIEDQRRADERIPDLLFTPAAVRWLSIEPMLGPINLTSIKAPREPDDPDLDTDWRFDALEVGDYYWFDGRDGQAGDSGDGPYRDHRIDWVVVGGESGPGARPMHPDWVRALRDQCAAATIHGDDAPVPFFFKQWGAWISHLDRDAEDPDWRAGYSSLERSDAFAFLNLAGGCGFHGERLHVMRRVGKKAAGRLLDGIQHDGAPA